MFALSSEAAVGTVLGVVFFFSLRDGLALMMLASHADPRRLRREFISLSVKKQKTRSTSLRMRLSCRGREGVGKPLTHLPGQCEGDHRGAFR